jgi:DNA-binding response OmpR family regulator
MNILLVEDDEMSKLALAKFLENEGHTMDVVPNGKIAKRAASENQYDLFILDVYMPKVSGFEVAEFLRNELTLKTPIIIVSRNHSQEFKEKAMKAGADKVLSKPFDPDAMLNIIQRLT